MYSFLEQLGLIGISCFKLDILFLLLLLFFYLISQIVQEHSM